MKKIFAALLLAATFCGKMEAQILPPDFLCVRGDTLFWDLPVNSCGPFVSYEIWGSQSLAGPFTLQGSVTNQGQDFYPFVNPSGEHWYFYLTSNFNCPGQMALPSDTLDNLPPEISPIELVTVENGQAVITWTPSPSPEVSGYIIYHQTNIGALPIDTVYSGTTFTDPDSDPNAASQSYFVNALDPCGNTSIFDAQHSTIFVEAVVEPCRQSVVLNWNKYEGWGNGIAQQQIWVGLNGSALAQAADAGPSANNYEVENVVDGATYCFEIHAVELATGLVSKSNQVCLVVDVFQSADGAFLKNVSVNDNGEVELDWNWNPAAELVEYRILRSNQNTNYQAIATQPIVPPLSANNTYADTDSDASSAKVFYKIETLDVCDSVLATNYGSTIFLTVNALPGNTNTNQLAWTAFDLENATATSYTVNKVVGNNVTQLATVGAMAIGYDDNYLPTSIEEAQACYFVVANAEVVGPNGELLPIKSRSNIACVEQAARIYVPNAFVPEGFNQEFRPLIVLGDIAKYEMLIFDRYGQQVFSTNDPQIGWNGQKNGKSLMQGVYAYVIKITQMNGKETDKRGTVLLIR